MKKIVFLLCVIFSCNTFAEDKISEYYSSIWKETYRIEASQPKNGKFEFFIYCHSFDAIHKKVGFSINSKDVEDFTSNLLSVKSKFLEWGKTAQQNNVDEYSKEFDIRFKSVDAFFLYGSEYKFAFNIRLKPKFMIIKGKPYAVFNSGKLVASSNRFMDVKGFSLVFSNADEFDEFIKALDVDNVLNKDSKEKQLDTLFQ